MALIAKKMAGKKPEQEDLQEQGESPKDSSADMREDVAEGEAPDGQTPGGAIDSEKFMYVVEAALTDKKSGLMEQIADAMSSAKDLPQSLADAAYDLVASIDEKTGGGLPDEDLASAAAETLGLIAEVAEAAGQQITGREISSATKLMISRFMEESGDAEGMAALEQQDADAVGAQLDQQEVA